MESVSVILSSWFANIGLRINLNKTDLVLFPRKYKNTFRLPRLGGQKFPLSSKVKNLGVILGS